MASPHKIRTFGDPVLKMQCRPIDAIDDLIKQLAADMLTSMYEAPGVGLAAPQVGVSKQLFVFDAGQGAGPFVVINPKITASEGEYTFEEGCLSVPGLQFLVTRADVVEVSGLDIDGNEQQFSATGYDAKILQHEIDHLNGKLVLDRLDKEQRKEAMRELRERQMKSPSS